MTAPNSILENETTHRKEDIKRFLLPERHSSKIISWSPWIYSIEFLQCGSAKYLKYQAKLVMVVPPGEHRPSGKHFAEYAPDRPAGNPLNRKKENRWNPQVTNVYLHIDGLGVLLESKHNLRCSIPSCGNILKCPCKVKIASLLCTMEYPTYLGHKPCFSTIWLSCPDWSCKSKVADFQIAVGVQ